MTSAKTACLFTTAAGTLLLGVGCVVDPKQALLSYLAAWSFAATVCVGTLLWVQIAHAVNAGWMVVLRRRAEDLLAALPGIALLFVPILVGLRFVYPWAAPEGSWSTPLREAMASKHVWLSAPFFTVRTTVYLATWIGIAELLRRYSAAQNESASEELVGKLQALAAASLPVVGLTLTFASFDWLMSLDPTWSSTVFGIYLFGGGFGAAAGLLAFVAFGPFSSRIADATPEHSHALGRIVLTFVIFWAYIAFSQYFLIWIADLPTEVGWIKLRTTGSWGAFAVVLAASCFVLPFFTLLSREVKRRPRVLSWMGLWLFAAHYLDLYWLVLPTLHATLHPHWLDVVALVTVCSASTWVALVRTKRMPEMPLRDPRLAAGLRYEAT